MLYMQYSAGHITCIRELLKHEKCEALLEALDGNGLRADELLERSSRNRPNGRDTPTRRQKLLEIRESMNEKRLGAEESAKKKADDSVRSRV